MLWHHLFFSGVEFMREFGVMLPTLMVARLLILPTHRRMPLLRDEGMPPLIKLGETGSLWRLWLMRIVSLTWSGWFRLTMVLRVV